MSGAANDLLADVAPATQTLTDSTDPPRGEDTMMPDAAAPAKRARARDDELPLTQELAAEKKEQEEILTHLAVMPAPGAAATRTPPRSAADAGTHDEIRATTGNGGETQAVLKGQALHVYNELVTAGYEEAEARLFAESQIDAMTDTQLVYALDQTERFSTKIFDESFSEALEQRIGAALNKKSLNQDVTVGLYRQYDASGTKHTILTAEFADADSAAVFKDGLLKHEGISFKIIELDAWLATLGAIKDVGKRFAAVFGPWPFMPTFDTVDQYKGLLTSTYGDITHVTIYKDRTITIGFALGGRATPKKRKPLAVMRNGKFMGSLHPTHNIRMLGLNNCLTCCGIGDFHGAECEENKKNFALHMAKKKKLNARLGARVRGDDKEEGEWEQVKGTRRGGRGARGPGRAVAEVAKKSWADEVGA